jgi:hypothetical protein
MHSEEGVISSISNTERQQLIGAASFMLHLLPPLATQLKTPFGLTAQKM